MARAKKTDLIDFGDTSVAPTQIAETDPRVKGAIKSTKVCSVECPHYTRASKECQECWEVLNGSHAR